MITTITKDEIAYCIGFNVRHGPDPNWSRERDVHWKVDMVNMDLHLYRQCYAVNEKNGVILLLKYGEAMHTINIDYDNHGHYININNIYHSENVNIIVVKDK